MILFWVFISFCLYYFYRRLGVVGSAVGFLTFAYYYFLHSVGFYFIANDYSLVDLVFYHDLFFLVICFFWGLVFSRVLYAPYFTFRWLKLHWSVILAFILFCFVALVLSTGDLRWFYSPRSAYQYSRGGSGFFYAIYLFSLGLGLVFLFRGRSRIRDGYPIIRVFILVVAAFFSGSKGVLLSLLITLFIIELQFSSGVRQLKIIIFSIPIFVITIFILGQMNFFGPELVSAVNHLDALNNSVRFYQHNQDFIGLFGGEYELFSVSTKSMIINSILNLLGIENQSFHQIYFPEMAALGHYPAHLSSTYLISSGLPLLVWPLVILFSEPVFIAKLALLFYLRRHVRDLRQDQISLFIVVIVFQPLLKFFGGVLLMFFLIATLSRSVIPPRNNLGLVRTQF